tara:strand:- start:608 stop:916 length:309 start_codon:yes stop_codon:yes gene_type:complete
MGSANNQHIKIMKDIELTNLLDLIHEHEDAHDEACSQVGDITAEYYGEVARYGDAWPGAQPQLARYRQSLDESLAEIQDLRAKLPPVQTCALPPVVEEECPF